MQGHVHWPLNRRYSNDGGTLICINVVVSSIKSHTAICTYSFNSTAAFLDQAQTEEVERVLRPQVITSITAVVLSTSCFFCGAQKTIKRRLQWGYAFY